MAFTASQTVATVWGNKLVKIFNVTADANSGTVSTGLSVIEALTVAPVSAATTGAKFKLNQSASSVVANGTMFCSSCTSGDQYTVIAIGH